ncbi:hypothetical protein SAMN05421810_11264 [Amycolatopsis arida]|uniref:Uncharacterized protein n=1 Tax=Amycolatopsis arida TaxID=587909 RepID=A0A1I6AF43_9PSEU|nr:hypothetical protein [Amycolatopsis arida]TDX97685.1 hypothetical protein CLV69_102791 [Amycolatopsis arida]SFQ67285.1 hypothetical protein SAMN05421810_11264 [Amycolatopsis arida]
MAGRTALVLAGTGMVDPVVHALTAQGWRVVLPSRRYNPIALRPGERGTERHGRGGRRAVGREGPGVAVWVAAHWDRPRELAAAVDRVLDEPADLLVAWVHESYRRSVLDVVEPLLASRAPVVEVRGGASPFGEPPEPVLAEHPTQLVLLGMVSERDSDRALSHTEMVDGILAAVRRAVDGRPPGVHQVGQLRQTSGY